MVELDPKNQEDLQILAAIKTCTESLSRRKPNYVLIYREACQQPENDNHRPRNLPLVQRFLQNYNPKYDAAGIIIILTSANGQDANDQRVDSLVYAIPKQSADLVRSKKSPAWAWVVDEKNAQGLQGFLVGVLKAAGLDGYELLLKGDAEAKSMAMKMGVREADFKLTDVKEPPSPTPPDMGSWQEIPVHMSQIRDAMESVVKIYARRNAVEKERR